MGVSCRVHRFAFRVRNESPRRNYFFRMQIGCANIGDECRSQFTLHATRQNASRRFTLVQALSAWSLKPDVLRPGIVGMRGARVHGHKTTAMHDMRVPSPQHKTETHSSILNPMRVTLGVYLVYCIASEFSEARLTGRGVSPYLTQQPL